MNYPRPGVYTNKEDSGKWKITTVSTAAVPDLEKETFTTNAMDYESKMADVTGEYPEYRMFHKEALAIGKVTKMYRVGIFAVDEGYAYDDPFSQAVCKEILATNSGEWRCSRGFYVIEAKGGCPNCGEQLMLNKEHMLFGFRCPTCKSVHLKYKGTLKEVRFLKTKTFDVTITDIPCQPWSGAGAVKSSLEVKEMTKDELKAKLLKAGLDEKIINGKLDHVSDTELKEYDDIPEARLLKEFAEEVPVEEVPVEEESVDDAADGEQTFVLDDAVLKSFADIVDQKLSERLDGLEVNVPDDMTVDFKEVPEFIQLAKDVAELKEMLKKLLVEDDERLKELNSDTPRNGKLRIIRMKSKDKKPVDPEDLNEDPNATMDEEDMTEEQLAAHNKKMSGFPIKKKEADIVIIGGDGKTAGSMTEFLRGGK